MKFMQRWVEIKSLSSDQMVDEIGKLKREQFYLRCQRANGQKITDTSRIRQIRRDVARIKTQLGKSKSM